MDEDQNLASLFANLNTISEQAMGGDRAGGGTGGGSLDTLGNMDPNPLIKLNPYLENNVTSFNYGGKYKTPNYNNGGQVPAAGQYEQQANQMIALGQLSNVFKGLQQGSMLAPQANKGMKMRKRYTQGGRF